MGEVKSLLRQKSDTEEDQEERAGREEGKERETNRERKRHVRGIEEDRGRRISPPHMQMHLHARRRGRGGRKVSYVPSL